MNALVTTAGFPDHWETFFNSVFSNDDRFFYGNQETYPPYNAWFEKDGSCKIEVAVSGFIKEEISIEFNGKTLSIRGEKSVKENETDERQWVKRGLAKRNFSRKFELRGNYILDSAVLKNGLLMITLKDDTKKVSVTIQEE